ncbi:MAG TPA: phenylalanine--tRNA ligase subunit alpha [Chthoniobacteraceae bacterium]|jgi:phenylalanyl-tRNA synthetase alpha chain|nr:phenylalanine--tRNA ligase subunit alpha [Chthoniobacteraceae bacterium]
MEQTLTDLRASALAELDTAADEPAVEAARVKYLGRSGSISLLSEGMKSLSKEEKPRIGKLLNEVRSQVTAAIDARKAALQEARDAAAFSNIDTTLPGIPASRGGLHPMTLLQDRAVRIFRRMGFALADGPDIETEWHCFDALNTPPDHPARNEQDTFYLPDGRLLRTQTSTIQVRTMEAQPPPVRIIGPGAAYRRDEIDATHLAQFTQMEGLYVDRGVTLADLKGTVEFFFRELFGGSAQVRFRPHFFPFTEPSFEIDIKAPALGGDRWLELAGCGMVDPAVFEAINARRGDNAYDPETVSGWAFGFGLERLAMIISSVPDIRYFIENDLRFLEQFR